MKAHALMSHHSRQFIWFEELGRTDVASVGGKNASLGEMFRELMPQGIRVPNGFAITAEAYRHVLRVGDLEKHLRGQLAGLDTRDLAGLARPVQVTGAPAERRA